MNDSSFEEIYTEAYPLIFRVAYRITGSKEASEDLTQEAFIKYFERMDVLPRDRQAVYWLIRVIKNLALNYEKRKTKERSAVGRFALDIKTTDENEGEKKVLKDESAEAVQKALLELPYKMRIVLILKEYAGFNYKEISNTLNISESNVKVRVHRARLKLADIIKEGDIYVP